MANTLSSTTTIIHFSSTNDGVNTPKPTPVEPTIDTFDTSSQERISSNIVIGVSASSIIAFILLIAGTFSPVLFIIWRNKNGNDKVDGSGTL